VRRRRIQCLTAVEYKLLGDLTLEELLKCRHQLPTIRGLDARAYPSKPADRVDMRLVGPGERDAMLFPKVARICQRVHQAGGTKEVAFTMAMTRHAEFPVPHENAERWVQDKVTYWWRLTLAGENRYGTGQRTHTVGWEERLACDDPQLHALVTFLWKRNGVDAEFWIANGLVGKHFTGWWSIDRLRDTRRRAISGMWVTQIVAAAQGRHALYRWGPTAMATIFV
jgi:hypothetical protein